MGSILQALVALFENFDEGSSLPRSQSANELHQIGCVRKVDRTVYVDTDFVRPVDEFEVKSLQQFFF